MWFKQIQFYELKNTISYQPELLAEKLQLFPFQPCLPSLPLSLGWVSPLDQDNSPLVFAADGYILIALAIAEKVLPATVIRQAVDEKVKEFEQSENRKIGYKQKQSLKDDIIQSLLPRAFIKTQKLYACIDTRNQWLWLATTNSKMSEHFHLAWSKVMPEIGLIKPELRKIAMILSHWVQHRSNPKAFSIEKNVVLQDARQQNRVIRCQQQDLTAANVQSFIKEGCEVRQLALTWQDRIQFTIDDELNLRGVRFSDQLLEREIAPMDSPELRMASDFVLLTANLTELTQDLLDCLGKKESAETASAKIELTTEESNLLTTVN